MSVEGIDDNLYGYQAGAPDKLRGELARVVGVREFGHVAVMGHDGLAGEVIFTVVALPELESE